MWNSTLAKLTQPDYSPKMHAWELHYCINLSSAHEKRHQQTMPQCKYIGQNKERQENFIAPKLSPYPRSQASDCLTTVQPSLGYQSSMQLWLVIARALGYIRNITLLDLCSNVKCYWQVSWLFSMSQNSEAKNMLHCYVIIEGIQIVFAAYSFMIHDGSQIYYSTACKHSNTIWYPMPSSPRQCRICHHQWHAGHCHGNTAPRCMLLKQHAGSWCSSWCIQ